MQTQEFPPTIWATAQLNLGVAYMARIQGDRQENRDLAIKHHEEPLQVFTRETNPVQWAMIQSNLGECYRKRITGQKSENIEQAIICLEAALQVCTREAYPIAWANIQSNLGLVYNECEQGDPAENLQHTIAYQEAALQVYTLKAFPFEWARIQLNMGKIYADYKGAWIEQAITSCQASLEVYTPDTTFERWEMAQRMMAASYIERSSGEREDNLGHARTCYETWLHATMARTQPSGHPYFALLNTCLRILAPQDAALAELEWLLPLYQHVIERLPTYELDWLRVFHMLASFLLDRFEESGRQEETERAIPLLEAVAQVLSAAEPMRFLIYHDLGRALFLRWAYKKQQDDLEQTIIRVRQALQATPTHATFFQISSQRRLGNALLNRYTLEGQPDDLEQSIESFTAALQIAPDSAALLANMSSALLNRYTRTEQLTDLEHARQCALSALEQTATDAPERAFVLVTASSYLNASYTRTGNLEELELAITYCGEAIQRTTVDMPNLPLYVSTLSHLLNTRYERTGRLEDLEQGIAFCRASMNRLLPGSLVRWTAHSFLASALLLRYRQTGNAEDVEEAIELCRSVLPQVKPNAPLRAALLDTMGAALVVRSSYDDHQANIEKALTACREAIACTPPDAPDLSIYLIHLGGMLIAHYGHSGALEDLWQAADTFTSALERIPQDSPALPTTVANLGIVLQLLYEQTGKQDLLEMAVHRNRAAVQLASLNLAALPQYLTFLGTALSLSYTHTGRYEELEEMLEVFERALIRVPATAPIATTITMQMGNALFARHLRTGSIEDLEQSITMLQRLLLDQPSTSLLRPGLLNILAMSWREHFERTNNNKMEDLEQALLYLRQASEELSPDSPLWPRVLDSLGGVLITRYLHTNDPQDLEMGTKALAQAFMKTPSDSPHWLPVAGNLGSALRYSYQHTREQEYLERAIEISREAVKQAPSGSPHRPILLKLLAHNLTLHFELTQFAQELEESTTIYEQACQEGLQQDLDLTLSAGREWGNYAWDRAKWDDAARAYSYALEAFELLYREQLSRESQQVRLQEALSLYERAAYAHCKIGKLREAVLILEQGRARSLNDALARDHADLEQVEQLQPETYRRYIQAAEYVRLLERGGMPSVALLQIEQQGSVPTQQFLPMHLRRARAELEAAIEAIRQLPSYADFLTHPTYEQLVQAAVVGVPLVYLAVTPANSIALLLQAGSTQPELLETAFSFDQQSQMFFKKDSDNTPSGGYLYGLLGDVQPWIEEVLSEALPALGRDLLAPLALRLQELHATGVVLITAGLLGVWPLHAARYLRDGRETFLGDEYAVAYAPSVRVLLAARCVAHQHREKAEHSIHLVGIVNPQPGRTGALAAQRELKRLFPLMRHEVDKKLAHLTQLYEGLPEEERQKLDVSLQESVELWERRLHEIQQFYLQEPEHLKQAELQWLSSLFARWL